MASQIYRDYLIVSVPISQDGHWIARVTISWRNGEDHGYEFLNGGGGGFESRQDAESFGLVIGKAWVEARESA